MRPAAWGTATATTFASGASRTIEGSTPRWGSIRSWAGSFGPCSAEQERSEIPSVRAANCFMGAILATVQNPVNKVDPGTVKVVELLYGFGQETEEKRRRRLQVGFRPHLGRGPM